MLRILYFARLRDALECSEELLDYQCSWTTVGELKEYLSQRNACWQQALNGNVLYAVNHTIAHVNDAISDGDEIAFFPPVTGG